MPEYPYYCPRCENEYSVFKRIANIEEPETCSRCGDDKSIRRIALSNFEKSSAVQPYFEPALGCIIKSKSQRAKIIKDRGMEEIGNTSTDTMYKIFEEQREKKAAREWDEL